MDTEFNYNYKKLNKVHLELLAALFMLIDHITWLLFKGYDTNILPISLHIVGRMAFPIFAFFIAEGYFYTRNKNKYILRIFIFSLISHIPYMLCSVTFQKYGWLSLIPFATGDGIDRFLNQGSVLFPYFIGLLMLKVYDNNNLNSMKKLLITTILALLAFPFDWSSIAPMVVLAIGTNRYKPLKQIINSYFWIIIYALVYFFAINKIYGLIQLATILALIPLYFYNGRKSDNPKVNKIMKYFLYLFYPIHLLIIGIISIFI